MGCEIEYLDTWKTFEALKKEGKVRSIGVSNFTIPQLQDLLDHCEIKPDVLQIESHPYLNNVYYKYNK